jgi:hypothetical protein
LVITNSKPPIIMAKIERHRFFMDSLRLLLGPGQGSAAEDSNRVAAPIVCSRTDGRLNLTRPTPRWCVGKTSTLSMLFIMLSGPTAWQSQEFLRA